MKYIIYYVTFYTNMMLNGGIPMKISWSLCWIISSIEILSFLVFAIFLWMRDVDASGVTQTTELKFINVGVLVLAYLIPILIQIIWLIINLVYSKKQNESTFV